LLIKTDPLSEEEQTMLETIHTVSADLVRHVPFDGAVVPTIEQIGEWWDGSGPLQLRGEAILPTARIIAVANAFVGMVSPRAHRMPLSFEQAVQSLLGQTGVRFDRRPVSALIHYLVNRQGNQTWAHFQDQPAEPPFLHRSQASPAAAAAAGAPPAPQPAGPDRATVGILRRLPAPETKKPGDDDPKTAAAPAPAVTARRRC
jgi:HD-GYP domain-containing protein (c-di-GMP phosphodiesterase class II)